MFRYVNRLDQRRVGQYEQGWADVPAWTTLLTMLFSHKNIIFYKHFSSTSASFFFESKLVRNSHLFVHAADRNFDIYSSIHCIPFWLCIESFLNDVYNGKQCTICGACLQSLTLHCLNDSIKSKKFEKQLYFAAKYI